MTKWLSKKFKIKHKMDWFKAILYIIVSVYVLSMILILLFGFLNSFKHWRDFQSGNIFGLPRQNELNTWGWRFDNYLKTFDSFYVQIKESGKLPREVRMWEMFGNSLIYAVGLSLFSMTSQIIMAYAIAKYDFKLKKFLYAVAVIVMLIPIIGSLASEVEFANFFGFQDSFIGIFIMRCKFTGIYFLVFYATFKGISWTYAEAAQIDGASHLKVFLSIMLPLIKSTIFAVFILLFIENWNDYYTPMIFLPNKPTIAYGLFQYQNSTATAMSTPIKLAACFLACVPILVVFVLFKNKIMGNVTMGGIKG